MAEADEVGKRYQGQLQRGVWEHLKAIRGDSMGISEDWWQRTLDRQGNMPKVMSRLQRHLMDQGEVVRLPDTDRDRARLAETMAKGSQFFDASMIKPGEVVIPVEASGRGFYIPLEPDDLGFPSSVPRIHVVAVPRSPDGMSFDVDVARHELGHMAEFQEDAQYSAWAFMRRRQAATDKKKARPRPLNSILDTKRYGRGEVAVEDEFGNPYMGKIYGEGESSITPGPHGIEGTNNEMFAMLIEALFANDNRFAQMFDYGGRGTTLDKELLEYVIGLLAIFGRDR